MEKDSRIIVDATVNAMVAKVWKLWNNPDDIVKWNTPDPSWHSPSSENDLRVGGKFKTRMEAKDGSFGFDFEGTYDSVVLNKEIAYTIDDGRKVTTTFTEKDGKTHLSTVFDPEEENDPEFQKQGWQAILSSFAQYAESN
jgi:uncharacterized protein YndB with AHSA1/START domain